MKVQIGQLYYFDNTSAYEKGLVHGLCIAIVRCIEKEKFAIIHLIKDTGKYGWSFEFRIPEGEHHTYLKTLEDPNDILRGIL